MYGKLPKLSQGNGDQERAKRHSFTLSGVGLLDAASNAKHFTPFLEKLCMCQFLLHTRSAQTTRCSTGQLTLEPIRIFGHLILLGKMKTCDSCLLLSGHFCVPYIYLFHCLSVWKVDLDKIDEKEFPKVLDLEFMDCILEEGEMLYIPPKWWHYVRSLTASFSVSFWWSHTGSPNPPAS